MGQHQFITYDEVKHTIHKAGLHNLVSTTHLRQRLTPAFSQPITSIKKIPIIVEPHHNQGLSTGYCSSSPANLDTSIPSPLKKRRVRFADGEKEPDQQPDMVEEDRIC